ncbi:S-adenosyl-L-methionine-dependent methyltransferase [Phanerochaete sordida]|uniref:RNA methyltransferase n=1 Tax=Phanerochaete sordida TaxID=48140 RepID=A0A9P3FXA0_9APHY|nr:S-adenosyl-L-methionine-dependent methyltransferase [Phanerochaete sordida]
MSRRNDLVPIHGNYHGYYSKRPFTEDRRLGLLPKDLFAGKRVLDVGCNEGLVTCQIGVSAPHIPRVWPALTGQPAEPAQSLAARKVVGVDIDEALVRAAWKRRRAVWSQQAPPDALCAPSNGDERAGTKRRRGASPEAARAPCADYFSASCEHMFGPLPVPAHTTRPDAFPHNVTFRAADWVAAEVAEDAEGYDVVVAFSISKWIHLNGGDEGLMRFFRRVHAVLRSGGVFVLEPQPWDTYGKAKRMDARLKETAKNLKIRPDDFPRILQEIGFGEADHRGETGEGGFHRPIDLYRKR